MAEFSNKEEILIRITSTLAHNVYNEDGALNDPQKMNITIDGQEYEFEVIAATTDEKYAEFDVNGYFGAFVRCIKTTNPEIISKHSILELHRGSEPWTQPNISEILGDNELVQAMFTGVPGGADLTFMFVDVMQKIFTFLQEPDMQNNIEYAFGSEVPDSYAVAYQFAEKVADDLGIDMSDIIQTGHSQGALIAELLVAAGAGGFAYGFDTPGPRAILDDLEDVMYNLTGETYNFSDNPDDYNDKIINVNANGCYISKFGEQIGEVYKIDVTGSLHSKAIAHIDHLGVLMAGGLGWVGIFSALKEHEMAELEKFRLNALDK